MNTLQLWPHYLLNYLGTYISGRGALLGWPRVALLKCSQTDTGRSDSGAPVLIVRAAGGQLHCATSAHHMSATPPVETQRCT
jgi:hypothetical protein